MKSPGSIEYYTFFIGIYLKSIKLPKGIEEIGEAAFLRCPELERVEFIGSPTFELNVFGGCPKLPPETVAIGLLRSTDITRPFSKSDIGEIAENAISVPDYLRPDVFELLAKNNCFRDCDLRYLFETAMGENKPEVFPIAEQYGLLEGAELVDCLISYAIERKNVELTAYLLELKKRKFGFNGGDRFEL